MFTESGLYVVVRQEPGRDDWIISVLNFATYKHAKIRYATEAEARAAYVLWSL